METDSHREEGEGFRRGWIGVQYVWGHLYMVGIEVGRTLQVGGGQGRDTGKGHSTLLLPVQFHR